MKNLERYVRGNAGAPELGRCFPPGPRESNGYPDNLIILASGGPEAAKRLAPGRGFSYIIQLICIPSSLSFM
jgi:hypothetical protein